MRSEPFGAGRVVSAVPELAVAAFEPAGEGGSEVVADWMAEKRLCGFSRASGDDLGALR
jgi:hypothetical protein